MYQAQVWNKEGTGPYESTGMCEHNEKGHEKWNNFALMGHAETRAVVRAIRKMCPVSGVKSDEDMENIEVSQGQMATINKVLEQAEEAKQKAEAKKKVPMQFDDTPTETKTQIIKSNPNPSPSIPEPTKPNVNPNPDVQLEHATKKKPAMAFDDDDIPENPEDM